MERTEEEKGGEGMILLNPFPIGKLRDEIIRTTIKAETTEGEEIGAIAVFRLYTVERMKQK